MGDLVWVRIFFPKPLKLQIFSLTYNDVRFFFQHYIRHEGIFFPQVYPCKLSPLEISLQDIFFPEITYDLLKSKIIGR